MSGKRPGPMDVLERLERSNCRECGLPTCMAFAALVVQGQRRLEDCPRLDPVVARELSGRLGETLESAASDREETVEMLRGMMDGIVLADAADRVGGTMVGDRLEIRCFGKSFGLDASGNLHSECHVNLMVQLPLLQYLAHCRGREVEGTWVPFRDLEGSRDWVRFFEHRCEGVIRRFADLDPELFLDTLDLFSARTVERGTSELTATADEVFVLHPLPRLPVLVAYWRQEGEFESRFALLFDRSADENFSAEGIFRLVSGIVEMLRKIMQRHGHVLS